MKKISVIFLFFTLFTINALHAKGDKEVVYIMGVSHAFNDSVVYFTEIIPMEGIKLESHSRILPNRQHYAYELKDYMNFKEGKPGRMSVIYFSKKRKSLEKTENKIKRKVLYRGKTVRYLGDKFKFTLP